MQFVPISTFVDTSFWSEVNKKKLNDWRLDESPKRVHASYSIYDAEGSDSRLSLSHDSFLDDDDPLPLLSGHAIVSNILDSFLKMDRKTVATEAAKQVWTVIESGMWLARPQLLNTFVFTVFADLKKFKYHYWTCVPVFALHGLTQVAGAQEVADAVNRQLIAYLESSRQPVFLMLNDGSPAPLATLDALPAEAEFHVVVADPCTTPGVAGWLTRNVLTAVWRRRADRKTIALISLRGTRSYSFTVERSMDLASMPSSVVGWERDGRNEMRPRTVDLSRQFHPHKLMEQAVDLNVSLIKWRLVPDLDTGRFALLKCLLLGAGTLGCNVARSLIGWGVRTITFVDNGTVSYSNPVRQSLSEFDDAQNGRKKAEVAVSSLLRIFPSLNVSAVDMTIPMPGHTLDPQQEAEVHTAFSTLSSLIADHDVVFLLLDSREARWLPTLLASSLGKLCFSVALGFDTYVVIRHGVQAEQAGREAAAGPSTSTGSFVPASALGCYFCSDVTAPGNSLNDRTLDQQCTVARPGLSQIASGTAVEVLASVLQHANPLEAPAWCGEGHGEEETGLLGSAPHQVRGFVFRFSTMTPCVRRFERCIACGQAMREALRERGAALMVDACNDPSLLERISGLDELQASVDNIQIDVSDDESIDAF